MLKTELGTTGIEISEVIYGAGSIGGIGSSSLTRGRGLTPDEGMKRLDEAWDLGVRVVDTADQYGGGASELTIGRWLQERPHLDVLIQTKVGGLRSDRTDLSADSVRTQLATSIRRMGRVDLFSSHAPDPVTPLEETLEAFAAALEGGLIRAFGMSNVSVGLLENLLSTADGHGLPRPSWIQNGFSLLDRTDELEVLPLVHAEGLGYQAFSPLAGGMLSNRYLDGNGAPADSRIGIAGEIYYPGVLTEANLRKVRQLRNLASELNASTAGVALGWLRAHRLVDSFIVSPSTAEQWASVQEAVGMTLDSEQFDRVSAIFASDRYNG